MLQSPYSELSRACLVQAEEALAMGDLRTASEKGWSAASHMVYAVAEARGWEPEDQQEPWATYGLISKLTKEYTDSDLRIQFAAAGELRTNSSEGFFAHLEVEHSLVTIAKLLSRLDNAMASGGPVRGHAVRDEPQEPYTG